LLKNTVPTKQFQFTIAQTQDLIFPAGP